MSRSIFCGNLDYDARHSELERLFSRYGKVDRVDVKSGFAFIYMDDERDAEDAIRGLDRIEFGRHGRQLRQERNSRRSGSSRRPSANTRPSKTLFVINFDSINTKTQDLERHFEPYGKILNVRIRRNFAFIQFDAQEDATKALEATHMSKLMDRVISVEYAVRDDDDRRNGYSPDRRGRERSRSRDRGRPSSPYGRGMERASPNYGRAPSPYAKAEERASPSYERAQSPADNRDHSLLVQSLPMKAGNISKPSTQVPVDPKKCVVVQRILIDVCLLCRDDLALSVFSIRLCVMT
ncbi:hypothetical protein MUK42_26379 [Musa troglodytarum]|uniref:RRM domain-containing protein n=3 Tax=Musa troglodytarum TaxID=320322 RepID=A0A9E7FQM1_9LILI|nr:hypothetical protein MUK42_26379 [Musa troglodytarum]